MLFMGLSRKLMVSYNNCDLCVCMHECVCALHVHTCTCKLCLYTLTGAMATYMNYIAGSIVHKVRIKLKHHTVHFKSSTGAKVYSSMASCVH